jgi:hypothetical protein
MAHKWRIILKIGAKAPLIWCEAKTARLRCWYENDARLTRKCCFASLTPLTQLALLTPRLTQLTPLTPRLTLQAARGRDSTLCLLARWRLLARGYASLCMAERTGCPILLSLWSYVTILLTGPTIYPCSSIAWDCLTSLIRVYCRNIAYSRAYGARSLILLRIFFYVAIRYNVGKIVFKSVL